MTIKDYFQGKVGLLQVPISVENLGLFLQSKGLNADEEIGNFKDMDILFLEIILMLLAQPNISEGDMSISHNREGLVQFYKAECKRLGVEDVLSKASQPEVRDMSFLA